MVVPCHIFAQTSLGFPFINPPSSPPSFPLVPLSPSFPTTKCNHHQHLSLATNACATGLAKNTCATGLLSLTNTDLWHQQALLHLHLDYPIPNQHIMRSRGLSRTILSMATSTVCSLAAIDRHTTRLVMHVSIAQATIATLSLLYLLHYASIYCFLVSHPARPHHVTRPLPSHLL